MMNVGFRPVNSRAVNVKFAQQPPTYKEIDADDSLTSEQKRNKKVLRDAIVLSNTINAELDKKIAQIRSWFENNQTPNALQAGSPESPKEEE